MINFCKNHWMSLTIGAVCAAALIWGAAYWLDTTSLEEEVPVVAVEEEEINS